jgi:hypothetical protein
MPNARGRKTISLKVNSASGVLQCTPVPGFVIGRNHKVIYWNRALEELYKE